MNPCIYNPYPHIPIVIHITIVKVIYDMILNFLMQILCQFKVGKNGPVAMIIYEE